MGAVEITLGALSVASGLVAWGMFAATIVRFVQIIRLGQPDNSRNAPVMARLATMVKEFAAHTRMNRYRNVGPWHWLVMWGFLLGSLALFEAYGEVFVPTWGWPLLDELSAFHLLMEVLGVGTIVGIVVLMVVRQRNHPRRAGRVSRFQGSNFAWAYFIEAVVLVEGIGILGVRAGKSALGVDEVPTWAAFVSGPVGELLPASPELVSAFAFVKLMSATVWLIVISRTMTMGVAWHRFSAFFNIYFKREDDGGTALGALQPMKSGGKELDFEEADPDTDIFGAGKVEDFSWKGLLDFTTCTECGRCQDQCPAWNTAKPLSPKMLITSLRDHAYAKAPYLMAGGSKDMAGDEVGITGDDAEERLGKIDALAQAEAERPLVGGPEESGVIDPEVLWACTGCGACVEQCPVDIEHLDHIVDMRRYQVLIESNFPTELGGMFKNLENKGNPWGQNSKDRLAWTEDLDFEVPVCDGELDEDTEYLFWVGCAGAFEDRAKKTTRAVAELLHIAGVKYSVLGPEETCTGDPARRAGNEFVFQMLAQQNVETLNSVFESREPSKRKIVATCAHCFNSLANEYSQLGGNYEVVHHTQLLNRLVREKRLTPVAPVAEDVTYHDPCYIGRHNKVYEPPRELVGASGANFREMPRHADRAMCCGAGGARMWMEEKTGKRINQERVDEALSTAPQKIATGCPFCRVMLTDGLTGRQNEGAASEDVEVVDVAQMLLSSVKRGTDGASAEQPDGSSEAPGASDDTAGGSSGGAAEHGGEAEANGKADVATDSEPTGTPLPDQDKEEPQ